MADKKKNLIKIWQEYADNNERFILNPDEEFVEKIAEGVLENEKKLGLKYCPCRLTSGNKQEDYKLICPCNFFIQEKWEKKGECWCGLFKKPK